MKKFTLGFAVLFLLVSCQKENLLLPKPRLYPKIEFPKKTFEKFEQNYCPFGFDFPAYAKIEKDDLFFEDKPAHPCWFDVVIPSLNGKLHCSYYPIEGRNSFDKLIQDAFKLAGKHNIKADYYDESVLNYPGNVKGIMFEIEGDVATPIQFFLSDSTNHFFRASLYFENKVQVDSMAPVYEFVRQDIDTLLSTFYWK